MRKMILLVMLVLSIFSMTSCDEEEDLTIYEGYVVEKIFDEGYTYTTTVMVNKTPMTQFHRFPDKWYVVIYKDEKISKHQISKEYYDILTVGSYISLANKVVE